MRTIPSLPSTPLSLSTFHGLAHPLKAQTSQFTQTLNMSAHNYPAVSRRPPLYKLSTHNTSTQLFAHNSLLQLRDNSLYYKNSALASLSPGKKQILSMGGNIIIFPDKLIYSPQTHTVKNLEATYTNPNNTMLSFAQADGSPYTINHIGQTPPTNPSNGQTWLNVNTNVLTQYDAQSETFLPISELYVALSAPGIGAPFNVGDGVNISGITQQNGESLLGSRILTHVSTNLIVFNGVLNAPRSQNAISISRSLPDVDNICVWNNRLWACKGHELYASKLGDPSNFYFFNGLSTDSFALTLDNKQPFTSMYVFDDELLLFCEDEIFKISGNRPANYRVSRNIALGVEHNSPQSICQIDNKLYYVSSQGICRYHHSIDIVDSSLSPPNWQGAIAFPLKDNLMLCTKTDGIYSYNTIHQIWYKWSNLNVTSAIALNGSAYIVDDKNNIYCTDNSNDGIMETNIPWLFQTSDIALKLPNNRFVDKLELNMQGTGSYQISLAFDTNQNPTWKPLTQGEFTQNINKRITIRNHNFHHIRLSLQGIGDVTLISLILYTRNKI